jgi:hypothetical protein
MANDLNEEGFWEIEFVVTETALGLMRRPNHGRRGGFALQGSARSSFYVYDIEVTGNNPARQQPVQLDPATFCGTCQFCTGGGVIAAVAVETVERYNMLYDEYVQALTPGAVTDLAGTPFLSVDSVNDGVTVRVVERNGANALHVTNRSQGFHGINILNEQLALSVGDIITITGRTGSNWPAANTRMELLLNWSPWTSVQGPAALGPNVAFSIDHTVTAANLTHINERGIVRIIGNGWDGVNVANMDFYIYSIVVSSVVGGGTGPVETEIRYIMQDDYYVQSLAAGTPTQLHGTAYIGVYGECTVTAGVRGGNRYLHVTNRSGNHHGVFITTDVNFTPGDTVRVTGRLGREVPTAWSAMILNFSPGGWEERAQSNRLDSIGAGGVFVLEHVLTAADIAIIQGASTPGILIQTNNAPNMDFFIDNIEVLLVGEDMVFTPPAVTPIWSVAPVVLRFVVGHTSYTRNGIPFIFDAATFVQGGRTLVPLRVIAEAMGLAISRDFNATPRTVSLHSANATLTLAIDEPLPNNLGTPVIRDGRVFVPMRAVSEFFGAVIERDEEGNEQVLYLLIP